MKVFFIFFSDLTRPSNLFQFYVKNEGDAKKKQIAENFKKFIAYNFTSGIKNRECRRFVTQWFADIATLKLWAIQSINFDIQYYFFSTRSSYFRFKF